MDITLSPRGFLGKPEDEVAFDQHRVILALFRSRFQRQRATKAHPRPLLEQAVAQAEICNKIRPPNAAQRIQLGSLAWLLADTQPKLGAYRAAAGDAEKLHTICSDRWQESFQAAKLLMRCVPLAEQDKQLSVNARQSDAKHFGHRSVEMLQETFRLWLQRPPHSQGG